LPRGCPEPVVPSDNPMTAEKVELGRLLFYDRRLSLDGSYACASCHQQARAFTDGRARAVGVTGQEHPHSAMALANVAYNPDFLWADPRVRTLERQAEQPLFNEHPIEMGLKGHEADTLARLSADPLYARLFASAFPGETPGIDTVARAIASFERTLISGRSAFDRYVFDDERTALSAEARAGMALFYSQRVGCVQCHFGINFSGALVTSATPGARASYANTALYNVDGSGRYPDSDRGVEQDTRRARDHGKFRVPGLRNVAVTAPYMHDGSIATLAEVIDHYADGGRQAPLGPAKHNRYRDARLKPLSLSSDERRELVAFLESLTDEAFLHDPRFAAPAAEAMASDR